MSTQHTPGPWNVAAVNGIYDAGKFRIEHQHFGAHPIAHTDTAANARLIAESPAMFQVLEKLADTLDDALLTHIFDDPEEAAESDEMRLILEARAIRARVKGEA